MPNKSVPARATLITAILLGTYLIIRLVNHSKLLSIFPLSNINDLSSHIAKLYFLAHYGFHGIVPHWYNGFVLFKFYPPGWFFFTLPLYWLTKNAQVATYISTVLIFVLLLLACLLLGRIMKLSKLQTIAVYLFTFTNPLAIGNFIRLGRVPELFGWLVFVITLTLIIYYVDKNMDYKYLILLMLLMSALMLAYHSLYMLMSVILLGVFLARGLRDKIIILLGLGGSLACTSFWWIPFIAGLKDTSIASPQYQFTRALLSLDLSSLAVLSVIIPLVLFIMTYLFVKHNKDTKLKPIVIPVVLVALIVVSRIVVVIPFYNQITMDIYFTLFILFGSLLLFKIDLSQLSHIHPRIIAIGMIGVAIIFVLTSAACTNWFPEPTQLEYDLEQAFTHVNGSYILLNTPSDTSWPAAWVSYVAIKYNLTTPTGWSPHDASAEQIILVSNIHTSLASRDCDVFITYFSKSQAIEIIGFYDQCNLLEDCGLHQKYAKDNICVYTA